MEDNNFKKLLQELESFNPIEKILEFENDDFSNDDLEQILKDITTDKED